MKNLDPVTVVLPSKNHEKSIFLNIEKLLRFLDENFAEYQIMIISNGSTKQNVKQLDNEVFENEKIDISIIDPLGKGHAVKHGLNNSKFNHVILFDSDFSYDVELIHKVYQKGVPIAPFVCARRVVNRELFSTLSLLRYFAGITFNFAVRRFLKINSKDTQAGFKFIDKSRFQQFSKFYSNDYLYDVELFLLAQKYNIETKEICVRSLNTPLGSNIKLFSDSLIMLRNLYKIKKHYLP